MKKLLKYISVATIALVIVSSCEDQYEAPGETSKNLVVYNNQTNFGNQVQVNDSITFADVSSGVISRTWTLPENIGTAVSTGTSMSTADLDYFVFSEPGKHEVKLSLDFGEPFYINGFQQEETSYDSLIIVDVLDSVRLTITGQRLDKDGNVESSLDMSTGALNEVVSSRSVSYSYTATGEPAELIYMLDGSDPARVDYVAADLEAGTADVTTVKYKKVGTYDAVFLARRTRPAGIDTVVFRDFIKVVPSSDPVDLDALTEVDNKVELNFSREMDATTINPSDFDILIENNGIEIKPLVSSIDLKAGEQNVVVITFSEETLYNTDTVTVDFTAGSLMTSDGVLVTDFSERVDFGADNLLEVQGGFEGSSSSNWGQVYWNGADLGQTVSVVTDFARTGSNSLKFVGLDGGFAEALNNTDPFGSPIEAGAQYRLSGWIYVTAATGAGTFNQIGLFIPEDWGTQAETTFSSVSFNQWHQISKVFNASSISTYCYFRLLDGGTLWLDDVELRLWEPRPMN
ncbi:Ig-like domain-containing protein [Reichenbachiella versicolor]|uniref:Ig-like domain-containing protein n=1 Tax=Reichenbachiella versicolor TaxID=1821036 RepID=UPI000D6DE717|nr:Ig-like domain-containing protein [Reichenbachiella versicolor]